MNEKRNAANRITGYKRLVSALGALAVGVAAAAGPAFSQTHEWRRYGASAPFEIEDLPLGKLRSALDRLPTQSRARAKRWLHEFTFPAADVKFLRVDRQGGVFYEDPSAEGIEAPVTAGSDPLLEEITFNEAFTLHSKPGAPNTVYLDMDGHVVSGTVWNSTSGYSTLDMRPYDSDGDETSFSPSELNAIAETWKRVAEDYAPYDIDVTTEAPLSFGRNVGHILVTRNADQFGHTIYNCSCGGVAYINVWGKSYYTYYQPALVFLDGVGTGAHNISEAASHELGHHLSLTHDGTSTSSYYTGHGGGNTDWAPIMGVGYYGEVTQWSQGEYTDANNPEDDLQLIADRLTYSPDDHVDSDFDQATPLIVTAGGSVFSTTPVTDPENFSPANKGVIENRFDTDLFSVEVSSGTFDLTVSPVWLDAFTSQNYRGANLDVKAMLYDSSRTEVAQSNPTSETDARITTSVGAGRYILAIEGTGTGSPPATGYTAYASIGQYFINGMVPAAIADTTAPEPSPMTWALEPAANGPNSVVMQATEATDDSGGTVQYLFDCVSGGTGCVDSGWQTSRSYTASGLEPSTSYGFRVKSRDPSGNETAYSTEESATTDSAGPVSVAPVADAGPDQTVVDSDAADGESVTLDGSGSSDNDGTIVSYAWTWAGGGSATGVGPTVSLPDGTTVVTLTVTDNDGNTDTDTVSITVVGAPTSGWTELTYDDFESGWGNWVDGGSDAKLTTSYAIGNYSVNLQDNSSSSESRLASSLDLTAYSLLKIELSYVVRSFEGSEDFRVRYSSNGGSTWQTIKAFVNNVDFIDNGTRYDPVITIDNGSYAFSNNVMIKFECDASGNRDDVYIDNIRISAQ
jgi:hypothetical protein